MLDALFSSQVRIALLRLFLLRPETSFHARGLTRQIGAHYNAIWKELQNLERAGILESESQVRLKNYRLNPRCPILPELRSMFLKTAALGDALRPFFATSKEIDAAFIYGSAANNDLNADSDIDLMLIGNLNLTAFAPQIRKLESELGRSINYTFFTFAEWEAKRRAHDPFIENVVAAPKIFLSGGDDVLRKIDSAKAHQALSGKTRRSETTFEPRRARSRQRRT